MDLQLGHQHRESVAEDRGHGRRWRGSDRRGRRSNEPLAGHRLDAWHPAPQYGQESRLAERYQSVRAHQSLAEQHPAGLREREGDGPVVVREEVAERGLEPRPDRRRDADLVVVERREVAQQHVGLRQVAVALGLAHRTGEVNHPGVFTVGLAGVERLGLGELPDLLGTDQGRLMAGAAGDGEQRPLVAARGLAEHADAAEPVLGRERCRLAKRPLYGLGAIGDDILGDDLVMAGVEAREHVEGVAGDVGGEQEDGADLVGGGRGADLHGGPRRQTGGVVTIRKVCRPGSPRLRLMVWCRPTRGAGVLNSSGHGVYIASYSLPHQPRAAEPQTVLRPNALPNEPIRRRRDHARPNCCC